MHMHTIDACARACAAACRPERLVLRRPDAAVGAQEFTFDKVS